MRRFPLVRVCLVLALGLADVRLAAQSPQTPATPPVATPGQPAPQETPPETRRRRRSTRPSEREPQTPIQGSITENRVSRSPGPTQTTLVFDSNLLAGYDDNVVGGTGASGAVPASSMPSGTVGTLDATLAFATQNTRHAFRFDTTGLAYAYPDYLDGPTGGGTATVAGRTTAGRSTVFDVSQRVGYEPFFNALSPSAGAVLPPPGLDPTTATAGIFERRSITARSALSIAQQLGRRDTLAAGYSYGLVDFTDDEPGDNRAHTATAGYKRVVADGARIRTDYSFSDIRQSEVDGTDRPTTTHRIEGGVDIEHVVPTRRLVTWSVVAGASRLDSISQLDATPFSTWLPTGSGSVRVSLSSAWAVEARYLRDFQLLQGITNDVYATDTASITTSGALGRRTGLAVGATYGNWQTPVASGVNTTFDVYGASVQLRQMITDTLGLTASYNYYRHLYSDPAALPEGFPAEYDRNSVRVGLTVRVPIIGAPTRPAAVPR